MNKNNKNGSKAAQFLSGKGFYVALSLSIVMVGAACYAAYSRTTGNLENQVDSSSRNSAHVSETSDYADVGKAQPDIPKETTTNDLGHETTQVQPQIADAAQEAIQNDVPSNDTASTAEQMVMPIEGAIIKPFSNGELVKSETTNAWQTHNGADITGALGDEVMAMSAGTVTEVGEDGLYGVYVTIDHGSGIISKYCNLNSGVTVQAGNEVSAGTVIGAIGGTADIESAMEPHLHFEVMKNGQYVDPIEFLGIEGE